MKNNFPELLSRYFTSYMDKQRGMSKLTIDSYIDAFLQFFQFLKTEKNIAEAEIGFEIFKKRNIEEFLEYLIKKGNKNQTRNQRLAAFHSFSRYVLYEDLRYYDVCAAILKIPMMKTESKIIEYLSIEDTKTLLSTPGVHTKKGLRETALLTLLYSSGCRVSELINIKLKDMDFEYDVLTVTGKGRKMRKIPINKKTMKLIKEYLTQNKTETYLFVNHQNSKLTRAGVAHILEKNIKVCQKNNIAFYQGKISPHTMRHSIATHLLESGLPLIYIRDFLGHESVRATEVYAKTNPKLLNEAIEKHCKLIEVNSKFKGEVEQEVLSEFLLKLKS